MKLRIYYVYWMHREVQSSFQRLITRLTVLYDQKLKWKKNIQKQFNSKRQLLLQTPRTTDATTRTAFVKTPVDIFRSMLRVLKDRYQQQQKMHCGRISITSTSKHSTYHRGALIASTAMHRPLSLRLSSCRAGSRGRKGQSRVLLFDPVTFSLSLSTKCLLSHVCSLSHLLLLRFASTWLILHWLTAKQTNSLGLTVWHGKQDGRSALSTERSVSYRSDRGNNSL